MVPLRVPFVARCATRVLEKTVGTGGQVDDKQLYPLTTRFPHEGVPSSIRGWN